MNAKVLVFDDKKEDRDAIVKGFTSFDCEMVEIEDGTKVMETVKTSKPNLIIMDPNVTAGNGFEILQSLNSENITKNIPVIVLTAENKREKVIAAAQLGIKDYLLKPVKPAQLTQRITRIMDLPRKAKSIKDNVQILVVDDKPAIVEQIKAVAEGMPWEILSTAQAKDALDMVGNQAPDVILVSLNLPGDEGFDFFRAVRFDERTKHVPVFGMCVKVAVDEQARATQVGMTGIITKPIDVDDLRQRLTRAMNLDISQRYFSVKDNVLFVTFPQNLDTLANEISSLIKPQTATMVVSGMSRILLDFSQVNAMDANVLRLLIQIISYCDDLGVRYCVVGSAQMAGKAKSFEETKNTKIFETADEALKNLK